LNGRCHLVEQPNTTHPKSRTFRVVSTIRLCGVVVLLPSGPQAPTYLAPPLGGRGGRQSSIVTPWDA
jgi:hypothetical protein